MCQFVLLENVCIHLFVSYPTEDKLAADVWLLNSCTVKNPAEDHFRNEIKAGREAGKKVVVAGCVPQGREHSEGV